MVAIIVFLALPLTTLWPLPLDPNITSSLEIYMKYITGEKIEVSDFLGTVDVACAVGPFDSYLDARFSKTLTGKQIDAAEDALKTNSKVSLGDNQFFLVGLRDERVVSIYASNFFSNLPSLDKKLSPAQHCVRGDGFISSEKVGNTIAIKLSNGG